PTQRRNLLARRHAVADAAMGLKASRLGGIDVTLAACAADEARFSCEGLGPARFDDGAQLVAPSGFDRDVGLNARDKSRAETDGQWRGAVIRLKRCRRPSLYDACVDDRRRMQCRRNALPR